MKLNKNRPAFFCVILIGLISAFFVFQKVQAFEYNPDYNLQPIRKSGNAVLESFRLKFFDANSAQKLFKLADSSSIKAIPVPPAPVKIVLPPWNGLGGKIIGIWETLDSWRSRFPSAAFKENNYFHGELISVLPPIDISRVEAQISDKILNVKEQIVGILNQKFLGEFQRRPFVPPRPFLGFFSAQERQRTSTEISGKAEKFDLADLLPKKGAAVQSEKVRQSDSINEDVISQLVARISAKLPQVQQVLKETQVVKETQTKETQTVFNEQKLNEVQAALDQLKNKQELDRQSLFNAMSLNSRINVIPNNITIVNPTVSGGISGITDTDIPDTITASNYLLLAGGTLTGNLLANGGLLSNSASSTITNLVMVSATTTNATTTSLYVSGPAKFDGVVNLTAAISSGTSTITNLVVTNVSTSTFAGGLTVKTDKLVVDNQTGNVGIGTTAPGEKLEVVGNIISKGTSWTARTAAAANSWFSVTYGNGLFVAVALDGTNRVMTSPDGITWTARTATEANQWYSVTYGNGLFVAVAYDGTNRVMTSPDGITWTARAAAEANQWQSVTYGNGLFVAVTDSGTNRVMTSPDGITWTARAAAEANQWRGVTYGNGLFVAVAITGTNRVMTSPDGITWTARAAAVVSQWRGVTYGNGLFVAVASSGADLMTSPDGITWTARAAAEANSWREVVYGNGLFVAVAYGGTNQVMTSGKSELNVIPTNNIYQGGTTFFGNVGIGTTTSTGTTTLNRLLNIAGNSGPQLFLTEPGAGANLKHWYASTTLGSLTLGTLSDSLLTLTEYFRINSSGSVGIGTTTPSQLLSVHGNAFFSGNLANVANITATGTLTVSGTASSSIATALGIASTSPWGALSVEMGVNNPSFVVANNGSSSPSFYIGGVNQNGNVGIGTAAPGYKLDVSGDIRITSVDTFRIADGATQIGALYYTSPNVILESIGSRGIQFNTNSLERMRIQSDGNLGIGTTSPGSLLAVQGTGLFTGTLTAPNIIATGTLTLSGSSPLSFTNSATNTVALTNGLNFDSNTFVIDPNANSIGIGTAAPGGVTSAKLSVAGNIVVGTEATPAIISGPTIGGAIQILTDVNSANRYIQLGSIDTAGSFTPKLSIPNSGNVGIGTTSPNWPLQVAGTRPSFALSDTAAAANNKHWLFSSMGGNFYVGTSTDAYATSTPAALTILNSGNVGIGTTSPTSRIHADTTLSAATGDEVAYRLDYTTNKLTSGNDTGLVINQTDTASPGTSLLLDLRVDGASRLKINNGTESTITSGSALRLEATGDLTLNPSSGTILNNKVKIGLSTPSALGDLVVMGAVDFAAGDARLAIQGESGDYLLLGNNTVIGGTGTASDLTLQTTSGVGAAGADMHFLVGNNGATEAMTILNDGKVGIGTTSPSSLLHLTKTTAADTDLRFESQGYNWIMGIDNSAGGKFKIASSTTLGTNDRFVIDGRGMVTINGITGNMLVLNDGTDRITLNTNAGGGISFNMYNAILKNTDNNDSIEIGRAGGTNGLGFLVNSSEKMTINSTGLVGIGTTTPSQLLSVHGNAFFSGNLTNVANITATGTLTVSGTASSSIATALGIASTSPWGTLSVEMGVNNPAFVVANNGSSSPSFYIGGVNQDGNVGIGTSTPTAQLTIANGTSGVKISGDGTNTANITALGTAGKLYFGNEALATTAFIDNSGLGFNGTSGSAFIPRTAAVSSPTYQFQDDGNTGMYWLSANTMGLATDGTNALTINGSQNVGLSQTSPAYKLDVTGNGRFTTFVDAANFVATSTSVASTFAYNVGIGTTTPGALLAVQGTGLFTGTLTAPNIIATGTITSQTGTSSILSLGVGTTSPSASFSVSGNSYFAGSVGVGTTNPTAGKLHILGPESGTTQQLIVESTSASGQIGIYAPSGANAGILLREATDSKWFLAHRADIDDSFRIYSYDAAEYVFTIDTSRRVGIGTTSPGSLLSVHGNGLFSNNLSLAGLTATGTIALNAFPYTSLTASTEKNDVNFNLARTVQFASGNLATQRAMLVQAPTYAFTASSTLTDASTFLLTGAPKSGVFATSTNLYAFKIDAGSVLSSGGIAPTNAYGLYVSAPTGATNNYGAVFASGNVGIGTTTPSQLLSVHGNAFFSGNLTNVANITATGTLTVQSTTATSTFSTGGLTVGTSQFVVQQTSGNVGIGTTSPSFPLSIGSASPTYTVGQFGVSNPIYLMQSNPNIGFNIYYTDAFRFGAGSSANYGAIIGVPVTSGDIYFYTTNSGNEGAAATISARMVMKQGGNIGMGGDTSADALLEVSAAGGASDLFMLSSDAANDGDRFIVKNSGNVGIGTTTPGALLAVQGTGLFTGTLTAPNIIATGTITSRTGSSSILYLGVGTTSPSAPFSVSSNSYFAGNVGIGTAVPTRKLEVDGTASFNGNVTWLSGGIVDPGDIRIQAGSAASPSLRWPSTSNDSGFFSPGTDMVAYSVTGSEKFRIDTSGNVGIGTTTPKNLLEVNGGVAIGNNYNIAAPTNGLIVEGNVGIGTASPGSNLTIQGANVAVANATYGNLDLQISGAVTIDTGPSLTFTAADDAGGVYQRVMASIEGRHENGTSNDGYLQFKTNQPSGDNVLERMRITSAGLVGIGTTSPNWSLQIATTSSAGRIQLALTDPSAGANQKHWTLSSQGGNFYVATSSDALATSTVPAMVILSTGNVGIGTSSPSSKLSIEGTCIDTGVGCADYAELYPSTESVEAGDILIFDSNVSGAVRKAVQDQRSLLIGVVSSNPAIIIEGSALQLMSGSNYKSNPYKPALALAGKVLVKVNLEGGEIKIGDPITISSVDGIGKKAAESGKIIGYALENYFGPNDQNHGKALVFISLSNYETPFSIADNPLADKIINTVKGWFEGMQVFVENGLVKLKNLVVEKLTASIIEVLNLKVGDKDNPNGITIYDKITKQPYCLIIDNGQIQSVAGECNVNAASPIILDNNATSTPPADTEPLVVSDTEPPVIALTGASIIEIEIGVSWVDPGATVTDNVNDNLGIYYKVDGMETGNGGRDLPQTAIDTNIAGNHIITYTATDQAGNIGTATREVRVASPLALNTATTTPETATTTPN